MEENGDKWHIFAIPIFWPCAIYVAIGALLVGILFGMEKAIKKLGEYSCAPGIDKFGAFYWYRKIWFVLLFPLVWPVIFIFDLIVLSYSIIGASFVFIWRRIVYIIKKRGY